jgi:SAM-dependent methyltransferase
VADADYPLSAQDAYDLIEAQFNEALDESLDPVGPDVLYGYVAGMALPAGAVALDVGCREGRFTFELARRFGLQVTGIDPVPRCIEAGRAAAGPGDTVRFEVGVAEDLPVAGASADLVWCRDVLSLVADLTSAYGEFRRVLKPGGRALVYQMFATEHLEPADAALVLPALGCCLDSMRPQTAEAAITGAGLRIDQCIALGTEWGEYAQERALQPGRQLLHAARLIRAPDRYITRFGKANYDIKLADCLWHIYRMIGKLSSRIYLLSAPD